MSRLEEDGFGDFAWDLTYTDPAGGTQVYKGTGLANTDYFIWDAEVLLPTGGTVVEVERGAPDNTPGSYPPTATNNLVGVHLFG